jgi:hypothetical protein
MVVIVVGVIDRCGNRVVGARSSIRLGGTNCDLCDAMSGSLVKPECMY